MILWNLHWSKINLFLLLYLLYLELSLWCLSSCFIRKLYLTIYNLIVYIYIYKIFIKYEVTVKLLAVSKSILAVSKSVLSHSKWVYPVPQMKIWEDTALSTIHLPLLDTALAPATYHPLVLLKPSPHTGHHGKLHLLPIVPILPPVLHGLYHTSSNDVTHL